MSLWKIAWRSIQQRSVASSLTAFSMGLGVALVVAVLVIHGVVDKSFRRGSQGYDLIVGAKGGQLQLVLNTVFHLAQPVENIPYSYYEEFTKGRFASAVETAVPVCMGHEYKGVCTVATTPTMFDELTYLDDQHYEFAEGRNFKMENPFEAVVGATAAKKTGLKIGDTFKPVDSVPTAEEDPENHKHQPIEVVGILKHTGTPNDGAIFMNMEGFYRFGCHMAKPTVVQRILHGNKKSENEPAADQDQDAHEGHDHDADEGHDHNAHEGHDHDAHEEHEHEHGPREVTAVLVCSDTSKPRMAMTLPDVINEEEVAQAVAPSQVIAQLFDGIVGNIQLLLLILAVLVVVVAGIGIMVSIYNSMADRRHDIAIMRALGASRGVVMAVILLESILLSLGGGLFGLILGHGLIGILGPTIAEQTGVLVGAMQFQLVELILIPGLIILATLVGYLPAVAAYRTDVAKSLTANQ